MDNTNLTTRLILASVMLGLLGLIGCKTPSPKEMIAMSTDPKDPDRRRQGIAWMASTSWGMQDQYVKFYASVAANGNEDPAVRVAALDALGRAGDVRYQSAALAGLEASDADVRCAAAGALDHLAGDKAVNPLIRRVLEDEAMEVRAASATALRHYQRTEVLGALVRCLRDPDFSVRYEAHKSLVELTGMDKEYDWQAWRDAIVEQGKRP